MGDQAQLVSACLRELILASRRAGQAVDDASWRSDLIDAATITMARYRDVETSGWGVEHETGERAWLVEVLQGWPKTIWEDAHALGWIHEQYAARARAKSFAAHVQDEAKHASMTVSTQLYTPRWVADVLARGAMEVADPARLSVLDPAVGAGQMLLAALAVLAEADPEAEASRWVSSLWGFDLDLGAVEVARRTLALEVARRKGRRDEEAEALLQRQITERDGLAAGDGRRWSVVLSNPPYMGWRSMSKQMRAALDPRFRPYHGDLFAAFIRQCHELAEDAVGILAQQSFWYLRRFEKARRDLFARGDLKIFLHLGAGTFWNLSGEKASVAAFVQTTKGEGDAAPVRVWDLREIKGPGEKATAYHRGEMAETSFDLASASSVPGMPLCHDLPEELRRLFARLEPLEAVAEVPGGQNKTGRNRQFVRRWTEVNEEEMKSVQALGARGREDGQWVFYSKGGRFAPWWGNWEWVVDWSEQARRFYRENRTSNLLDERFWFRQGIVYTDFGGKRFNARWMPPGCIFDMTGPAIFPRSTLWPQVGEQERIGALLGVLNSSAARRMLSALNPTLHFQVRDIRALPMPQMSPVEAKALAGQVWELVEMLRQWHRGVAGDPLFDASFDASSGPKITKLERLEAAIDARVCAAYGVACRPLARTSVREHHALSGCWC